MRRSRHTCDRGASGSGSTAARPTCPRRSRASGPAAEQVGATQFETITAAAFDAFAEADVDVAVVEAGLGGRHDATNVVRSRVVLLTNVGLEHTDVLGDTVEAIAIEKLAVVHNDDTIVVIPDDTFRSLVPTGRVVLGGAREAAEAFVGHRIDTADATSTWACPGGSSDGRARCATAPTTPDGVDLAPRAPRPAGDYTICASILRDKDVDEMLGRPRAARRPFRRDDVVECPLAAGGRARRARAAALRGRGGGR